MTPNTSEPRPPGAAPSYVFANAWEQARQRLTALEAVFDPGTIQHLVARGVTHGWHCWEVGGGAGSITTWLCQRVGPNGHVLATDLDTRFLDTLAQPNLTVQRHDITVDPLPDTAFDLIHTRLVLNHLPTRDQVLARVLTGLKPGGWLLAEEFDAFSLPPDPAVQPEEVRVPLLAAMYKVMEARGIDLHYGRKLRSRMQAAGLVDLGAEGRVVLAPGGSLIAQGFQASLIQLRETILASGLLTPAAYDRDLHCLSDPAIVTLWPLLWAVWGRRPSP